MSDDVPVVYGTWWTFYTDAAGNACVLNIEVEHGHVLLTTSTGEVMRLTSTDAAMMLENLESAVDHCVKRRMPPE